MELVLPEFKYRFMKAMGNVIFPANFHPVGTRKAAADMVAAALANGTPEPGTGGTWLLVGGSGGFGSAARVALGADLGAHTFSVAFDAPPNPASNNKIRKLGSPGFHRNAAIEAGLRAAGLQAESASGDAFDPAFRDAVIERLRGEFGHAKLKGLVWALAAPRAVDPRTGETIASALKPLGAPASIRTFTGVDGDTGPQVDELTLQPGNAAEAIRTIFVMGGDVVARWIEALDAADLLDEGFTLITISYRGVDLNAPIYRDGLIGLAKADLEFQTRVIDKQLRDKVGGRAVAVEGPAVVTEASGGIPGVPFYMALLAEVMGDRFEDPLVSMRRMFAENFAAGTEPTLDEEGLLRMDDREVHEEVQAPLRARYEALPVGEVFPRDLFDRFMSAYARTRGFDVEGVDYSAAFETDGFAG